jgi:hypothetical protein
LFGIGAEGLDAGAGGGVEVVVVGAEGAVEAVGDIGGALAVVVGDDIVIDNAVWGEL